MIKAVVLDVDGTLTDGKLYFGAQGEQLKSFHVKDGYVLARLPLIGVLPIIITGRTSDIVAARARELNIVHVYQGITDKQGCCKKILEKLGCLWTETLYIGDDLNDLPCMTECGQRACPSDAVTEIKEICTYISPLKGGEGAVRDCIEKILSQSGQWRTFLHVATQ